MRNLKIYFVVFLLFFGFSFLNAQNKTVVSVTGSVYNELTKEPISVNLDIFDESGKKITRVKSNAKDGYYFITGLTPGKTYIIRNFLDMQSTLKLFRHKIEIAIPNTGQYAEFSRDILLKPMETGLALPFQVSPFSPPNKIVIRPGAEHFLQSNLDVIKENPKVKFQICAYPDTDKNPKNLSITESRAQAIKDFFVQKGIEASRLEIKGYSEIDPKNLPKTGKASKGKKYKGSIYLVVLGLM